MSTTHADALERTFYQAISDYPKIASQLARVRNRLLKGGFYAQEVVDAAFQKWERDQQITMIDAFGFACLWYYYLSGDIACCTVPLPSGPHADREIELNQAVLDQLPSGFVATFIPEHGRGADNDGTFLIENGIGLQRIFKKEGRTESWFAESDHTLALEVGTTSVSKTLYHLRARNGVARWPYGYEKIIVLAGVRTNAFNEALGTHRARKKLETAP